MKEQTWTPRGKPPFSPMGKLLPPIENDVHRERKILIVTGDSSSGSAKVDDTILLLKEYSKTQKVLIFDEHNMFGDYKTLSGETIKVSLISHEDIGRFVTQKKIEMRRVVPVNKYGKKMSPNEIEELMTKVAFDFRHGCTFLGVQDIFSVIRKDAHYMTASVTNNKTRDVDFVTHTSSVNDIHPKIFQNGDVIRMYHQVDDIASGKLKFHPHFPLFKIAQLIVDREHLNGNKRFYLYIDRDNAKIKGATKEAFEIAALTYLLLYPKALNKKLKEVNPDTAISRIAAIIELKEKFTKAYLD